MGYIFTSTELHGATTSTAQEANNVCNDNWIGVHPDERNYSSPGGTISSIKSSVMFTDLEDATEVTTHSAENAYTRVCEYADVL